MYLYNKFVVKYIIYHIDIYCRYYIIKACLPPVIHRVKVGLPPPGIHTYGGSTTELTDQTEVDIFFWETFIIFIVQYINLFNKQNKIR